MIKIKESGQEILKKAEWAAIATSGKDGPHLVGTWGDALRAFPLQGEDILLLPAGHYHRTEENLKQDPRVQILLCTREVKNSHGVPGQGLCLSGTAELRDSGPYFDRVRARFPWARAALVVTLRDSETQL